MKVILKADIKGVGKKDEVINASDGYARNFLFPKNLAVEANNENMAKLKAKQNSAKFQKEQDKEEALKVDADKLQDPDYIARYAREKYLYSKDGEFILRLP